MKDCQRRAFEVSVNIRRDTAGLLPNKHAGGRAGRRSCESYYRSSDHGILYSSNYLCYYTGFHGQTRRTLPALKPEQFTTEYHPRLWSLRELQ